MQIPLSSIAVPRYKDKSSLQRLQGHVRDDIEKTMPDPRLRLDTEADRKDAALETVRPSNFVDSLWPRLAAPGKDQPQPRLLRYISVQYEYQSKLLV